MDKKRELGIENEESRSVNVIFVVYRDWSKEEYRSECKCLNYLVLFEFFWNLIEKLGKEFCYIL